jgi:PAT family beta-lactamase induction signal transducer AmpG
LTSPHLSVSDAGTAALAGSHRAAPWVFMVLIMPFGLISGFLTVALAYELNLAGVSAAAIDGLIALSFLPNSRKFLWAPTAAASRR